MDFIQVYDNILTSEQCAHYINLIESGNQYPGKIAVKGREYSPETKVSIDINLSKDFPEEVSYLVWLVEELLMKYYDDCGVGFPRKKCEFFSGRKYPEGVGFYKRHVDAGNIETISRVITILIYLNSVEGGEIEFPMQNRIIDPAPGRVILFPSVWTHPHEAKPTTKGDRYIMRTFIRV